MIIALPIADRPRSFAFYRDGLGLTPVGEPADDGVPEPLQFALADGVHLMLIPTGGFGWVTGGRPTAAPGVSECLLTLPASTDAEVDDLTRRATDAGAELVTPPGAQPWGYTAVFADPDGHLWQVSTS